MSIDSGATPLRRQPGQCGGMRGAGATVAACVGLRPALPLYHCLPALPHTSKVFPFGRTARDTVQALNKLFNYLLIVVFGIRTTRDTG